jgi:hypothetical protein
MSVYSVGIVARKRNDSRDLYGFAIIGVTGHALLNFAYETKHEAEVAREHLLAALATAKVIEAAKQ